MTSQKFRTRDNFSQVHPAPYNHILKAIAAWPTVLLQRQFRTRDNFSQVHPAPYNHIKQ